MVVAHMNLTRGAARRVGSRNAPAQPTPSGNPERQVPGDLHPHETTDRVAAKAHLDL
jgi:hypothetical protein